jgi:hypothetical protein
VHFTILRDPEKIDGTPPAEMSLIAFPFKELFEVKLYDFDLIVFDRYSLNHILPDFYFDNIARYVKEGGAFLEASGPDYAGKNSLYYTTLSDILPGAPTGEVHNETFTPHITATGKTHPVTRSLAWKSENPEKPQWGPWMRQIGLTPVDDADVLMSGSKNAPLLLLDRVGEGRAAQIASDQIWLWARGYQGGGPHAELLRRVVHWLMKEPELDEKALGIAVDGSTITIRRSSFLNSSENIDVQKPDGTREKITLKDNGAGYLEHQMRADQIGIFEFTAADSESRTAIVGEADPPEFRNVLTSASVIAPLSTKTGGGVFWVSDEGMPTLKTVGGNARAFGNGWLGLRNNNAYTVSGSLEKSVLPLWLSIVLLLGLTVLTWWYEGKNR